MKVLGSAATFLVALSVMGGLILAQRDYQNSWREGATIQTSATNATSPGTPERVGEYNVVMN
jgi:hypothetical protein